MPSHSDSASSGAPSPMQPETPVLHSPSSYEGSSASPHLRPSPSARFALSQLFEAADPLAVLQQYPTSGRSLPSPRSARQDADATQPLRVRKLSVEEEDEEDSRDVDAPRFVLDRLGFEGSPAQWASKVGPRSSSGPSSAVPSSATASASEYSQSSVPSSSRYSQNTSAGDGFPVDVDSGDESFDTSHFQQSSISSRRGAGIPLAIVAPRQREQPSDWGLFASSAISPALSSARSSGSGTDHRGAALLQLQREELERMERAQRRAAAANSPREREHPVPSPRSLRSGLNSPRSPRFPAPSSNSGSSSKDEPSASIYLTRPQPSDVPMSAGEPANPYSPRGLPTPRLVRHADPSATPLHEMSSAQLPSLAPAAHLDLARQIAPHAHSFHSRSASDSSDASSALTASEEAHAVIAAHKAASSSRNNSGATARAQKSSPQAPSAAPSAGSHNSHASSATSASANASSSHAYRKPSAPASAASAPNMRVMPAHLTSGHITGAPSPALLGFVPAQMAKAAARAAREAAASSSPVATPRAATPPQAVPEPTPAESKLSRALSYGRGRDPGAVPFAAMGKQGQLKPTWEQQNRSASRTRSDSDGSGNGLGYLSASESIGSSSQHRGAEELRKASEAARVDTSPQFNSSSGHSRSGSASSGASKLGASALRERRLRAKAGRAESLGEELPKEFKHELANIATDIPMPKRRPPKSAKRPGQEAADQPTARAAVAPVPAVAAAQELTILQTEGREEVLASPAVERKEAGEESGRRPSIDSTASGNSWESTSSRVSSMEEQLKIAAPAPAPASSGSSVYSDHTGTIQNASRRESEADSVAAARAARSGSSSSNSDAHTVLRYATAPAPAAAAAATTPAEAHPPRSNSRLGLAQLRSRSRAHSRNGSTASSDSMSEGEAAILVARRYPAQGAPPTRAPPSPPQRTATAESYQAAAQSTSSHASNGSRAHDVGATPSHARRPSLSLLTGTGATRTTSADNVYSLAPGAPGSRPGTAPSANGIPGRPMRLRGAATSDGIELHGGRPGHLRNNSIDSDVSANNSFVSPSTTHGSTAGSHAGSGSLAGSHAGSSRFLNVNPAWSGYKHSNVSAESAASSLRWNNASETGSSRAGSQSVFSSSNGHAQQHPSSLQPGYASSQGGPAYESSPQHTYGRHQLSGYGRPSTGSSDGRGGGASAGMLQSRPTTASTTASHDGRLGSRAGLGLEDISPDHVSVSAGWRAAPVSPAGSATNSTHGGLASRMGIQLTLNEEDIELHEQEPIVTEQTSLFGVRRRLVSTYPNLGGKWPSAIARPKSSSKTGTDVPSEKPAWSVLVGSEKEMRKREEALEAREKELTIEAISKAEMATVAIEVWSEARKGRWIVKGPSQPGATPADSLPDIIDPWSIPVDAKGIVRRRKLKSNIEMSSTRTIIRCKECNQARQARIGILCHTCGDTGCVVMVYVVQCIVRLAQFTPLKLPAHHLLGVRQPNVKYLDAVDPSHREAVLRDRAIDGLQAAAGRVGRQHYTQHGSRLLMGKATISRRGLLTVAVTNHKGKGRRVFEVEDGADGKITEIDLKAASSEATLSAPNPAAFVPPPPSSFAPSDAGSTYGAAYESSPHSPAPSSFAPLRPPGIPRRDRSYSGSSNSAYGAGGAAGVADVNNYTQYGGGNRSTSPAPSRKANKLRGFFNGAR